jgi:hypothetical protein
VEALEESMSDMFSELDDLSRRLNDASDRINSTISVTNAKLNMLNLGLEVWLVNRPVFRSDCEEIWLGYCEIEGEWQLAVRRRTCEHGPLEDVDEEEIEDDCRPLLRASRALRLDALPLIRELADEIKHRAEGLLQEITNAERLVKNL